MKSWSYAAIACALGLPLATAFLACGSNNTQVVTDSSGGAGGNGTAGSSAGGSAASGGSEDDAGSVVLDASHSGESGADVFDPDAACAIATVVAKQIPANLLFVIDRTGSMNCNAPPIQTTEECEKYPAKKDANEKSKWEITSEALTGAWQGLQGTKPTPSVGVMFFNSDGHCGVPSAPDVSVGLLDPSQFSVLATKLGAVVPKGDTPIIGATMKAYDYLHSSGQQLTGNKFVVLLTDGSETCDPSNKGQLLKSAADAVKVGIRTFVLGAPGSEHERAFLSGVAFAGGTAASPTCDHAAGAPDQGDCHMDMTKTGTDFAAELKKNLEAISGVALSCEFDLPEPAPGEPPVDYSKVNVIYQDGKGKEHVILQDTNKACDDASNDGWQYVKGDKGTPEKIVLCGQACDTLKADTKASVSVQLGCLTQTVPR